MFQRLHKSQINPKLKQEAEDLLQRLEKLEKEQTRTNILMKNLVNKITQIELGFNAHFCGSVLSCDKAVKALSSLLEKKNSLKSFENYTKSHQIQIVDINKNS